MTFLQAFVCLVFVVTVCEWGTLAKLQCLSNSGEPVDWFIIYKIPEHVQSLPINSFYYLGPDVFSWVRPKVTIDQKGHAVYNTLAQIYDNKPRKISSTGESDLLYVMYNDQDDQLTDPTLRWRSTGHGHTKGVVAFDSSSGFWLVHSTPHFPPPRDTGYQWPDSGRTNGQTFLCISMDTNQNLDKIGKQLLYNYPLIYDKASSSYFDQKFPNMASAMASKHVTEEPWNSEMSLTSLGKIPFISFAKYSLYDKDLYKDWLAPRFEDTLYVETWQSGSGCRLCSNCTGKYKVYNVESISFEQGVTFKETTDHSKWAVTLMKMWTCIGDINRMRSQERRAGGTVCFQNIGVWKHFKNLVNSTHDCGPC